MKQTGTSVNKGSLKRDHECQAQGFNLLNTIIKQLEGRVLHTLPKTGSERAGSQISAFLHVAFVLSVFKSDLMAALILECLLRGKSPFSVVIESTMTNHFRPPTLIYVTTPLIGEAKLLSGEL